MDGRRRRKMLERIDLGIGFAAFFGVAFFAMTLITELNHDDAVGTAIPTLLAAALVFALWRLRRRIAAQSDGAADTPS